MIKKLQKLREKRANKLDKLMNGGRYHETDYVSLNREITAISTVIKILNEEIVERANRKNCVKCGESKEIWADGKCEECTLNEFH